MTNDKYYIFGTLEFLIGKITDAIQINLSNEELKIDIVKNNYRLCQSLLIISLHYESIEDEMTVELLSIFDELLSVLSITTDIKDFPDKKELERYKWVKKKKNIWIMTLANRKYYKIFYCLDSPPTFWCHFDLIYHIYKFAQILLDKKIFVSQENTVLILIQILVENSKANSIDEENYYYKIMNENFVALDRKSVV